MAGSSPSPPSLAGGDHLALTIAICTRDRWRELERAVVSLVRDLATLDGDRQERCELLIVDDSRLDEPTMARVAKLMRSTRSALRYHNKRDHAGVLLSRIESVRLARGEVVLFLDDDVEIEAGFLDRLLSAYEHHPDLAGLGGIDTIGKPMGWPRLIGEFLAGRAALRPGRLSASGYNRSSVRWPQKKQAFEADYLQGFAMSFRRAALADLRPVAWLTGYSLGDDIYLSLVARRHGALRVDPGLRVAHHCAADSFDGRSNHRLYHRNLVVNHAHLLRLSGARRWRWLCFAWTVNVLLAHHALAALAAPAAHRAFARARWHGTREGARELFRAFGRRMRLRNPSPAER